MKRLFFGISFLIAFAGSMAVPPRPAPEEMDKRGVVICITHDYTSAKDVLPAEDGQSPLMMRPGKSFENFLCFNVDLSRNCKFDDPEFEQMLAKTGESLAALKVNTENVVLGGDHPLTADFVFTLSQPGRIYSDEGALFAALMDFSLSSTIPPNIGGSISPHLRMTLLPRGYASVNRRGVINVPKEGYYEHYRYPLWQQGLKQIFLRGVFGESLMWLGEESFPLNSRGPRGTYFKMLGGNSVISSGDSFSSYFRIPMFEEDLHGLIGRKFYMPGERNPRIIADVKEREGALELIYTGRGLNRDQVRRWVLVGDSESKKTDVSFWKLNWPESMRKSISLTAYAPGAEIRPGDVLEVGDQKRVVVEVEVKEGKKIIKHDGDAIDYNKISLGQLIMVHARGQHLSAFPVNYTDDGWEKGWHRSENRFFVPHGEQAEKMYAPDTEIVLPSGEKRIVTEYHITSDGAFGHVSYRGEHVKGSEMPDHTPMALADRESKFVNAAPIAFTGDNYWVAGHNAEDRVFFVHNTAGNRDKYKGGEEIVLEEVGPVRIAEQIEGGNFLRVIYTVTN